MTATAREIANESLQSRAPAHAAKALIRQVDNTLLVGIGHDQKPFNAEREVQPGVYLQASSVQFLSADAATRAKIEQLANAVADRHNTRMGSIRHANDFYVIFGPQPSAFYNHHGLFNSSVVPAATKRAEVASRLRVPIEDESDEDEDADVEAANDYDAAQQAESHGFMDPVDVQLTAEDEAELDAASLALVDLWTDFNPDAQTVRIGWVKTSSGLTGALMEGGKGMPTAEVLAALGATAKEHGVQITYTMRGGNYGILASCDSVVAVLKALALSEAALQAMTYDTTDESRVVTDSWRHWQGHQADPAYRAELVGGVEELLPPQQRQEYLAEIQDQMDHSSMALVDFWADLHPELETVRVAWIGLDNGLMGSVMEIGRAKPTQALLSKLTQSGQDHGVETAYVMDGEDCALVAAHMDSFEDGANMGDLVRALVRREAGVVVVMDYDPEDGTRTVAEPERRLHGGGGSMDAETGNIFKKIGDSFRRKPDGIKRQIANLEAQIAKLKSKLKTMEPDAETEASVDNAAAGILDMAYSGDIEAASGALDELNDALGMECESNDEFETGATRRGKRRPKIRRKIVKAKRQRQRQKAVRSIGRSIRQASASAAASAASAPQDSGGGSSGGSDSGGGSSGSDGGGGGGYAEEEYAPASTTIILADGGDDDGEEYEEEEIIELEGFGEDDEDDDDALDDDLDDLDDDDLDSILEDLLDPEGDDVDDDDDVNTGSVQDLLGARRTRRDTSPEGSPYHGFGGPPEPCMGQGYHRKIDAILAGMDDDDLDDDDLDDDDTTDEFDEDDDTEDSNELLAGLDDDGFDLDDETDEIDDEDDEDSCECHGTCKECRER